MIPIEGPISIQDLKNEFGDLGNSLSNYYGVAVGVPPSGTISLEDFRGSETGTPKDDPPLP